MCLGSAKYKDEWCHEFPVYIGAPEISRDHQFHHEAPEVTSVVTTGLTAVDARADEIARVCFGFVGAADSCNVGRVF